MKIASARDQQPEVPRQADVPFSLCGAQPAIDGFDAVETQIFEPPNLIFGVLIIHLQLVRMRKDSHATGRVDQSDRVRRRKSFLLDISRCTLGEKLVECFLDRGDVALSNQEAGEGRPADYLVACQADDLVVWNIEAEILQSGCYLGISLSSGVTEPLQG